MNILCIIKKEKNSKDMDLLQKLYTKKWEKKP